MFKWIQTIFNLITKGNKMEPHQIQLALSLLERSVVAQERMAAAYDKSIGDTAEDLADTLTAPPNQTVGTQGASPPPPPPAGNQPPPVDYSNLKTPQLQELCRGRVPPIVWKPGVRAKALIALLQAADAAQAGGATPPPAGQAPPDDANPFAGQGTQGAPPPADDVNPFAGMNVNMPPAGVPTIPDLEAALNLWFEKRGTDPQAVPNFKKMVFDNYGVHLVAEIPEDKRQDFLIKLAQT